MNRELLIKALEELDNADSFGVPGLKPLINDIQDELAKPEPEPDYRRVLKEINEFIIDQPEGTDSLYSHTAQQKPLSDDEIKQLWEESLLNTNSFTLKFARAIEQAHGIK